MVAAEDTEDRETQDMPGVNCSSSPRLRETGIVGKNLTASDALAGYYAVNQMPLGSI